MARSANLQLSAVCQRNPAAFMARSLCSYPSLYTTVCFKQWRSPWCRHNARLRIRHCSKRIVLYSEVLGWNHIAISLAETKECSVSKRRQAQAFKGDFGPQVCGLWTDCVAEHSLLLYTAQTLKLHRAHDQKSLCLIGAHNFDVTYNFPVHLNTMADMKPKDSYTDCHQGLLVIGESAGHWKMPHSQNQKYSPTS